MNYLKQILAEKKRLSEQLNDLIKDMAFTQLVQRQRDEDALIIALHNTQLSAKTKKEIYTYFKKFYNEINNMCLEDVKDDPQFSYTKGKVDGILKQEYESYGLQFHPWEERYNCEG